MHTNWKTRVLAAIVLTFGMATTIATSPIEYMLSDSVATSREDGSPTSVVVFMDTESAANARGVTFYLTLESFEDPGPVIVTLDDPSRAPVTLQPETVGTESTGITYRVTHGESSSPITCYEGAERCSYVFTFEPTNPVAYSLSGDVRVDGGEEFAEDAVFIVDAAR